MSTLNGKKSTLFGGSHGAHTAKKPPAKKARAKRRGKGKRALVCLLCVALILAAGYLVAVYSHIPFIENIRTLYIETAMSTLNHQWLATALIPGSVIDEVMAGIDKQLEDNQISESVLPPGLTDLPWTETQGPEISAPPADGTAVPSGDTQGTQGGGTPDGGIPGAAPPDTAPVTPEPPAEPTALDRLLAMFPQIDASTLPADLELENIQQTEMEELGVKTTVGDTVWGIDMPNEVLIVIVEDTGYKGKLAICKGSSRTILGVNTRYTSRGETVVEYSEDYDAVIGINAGAFEDRDGRGRGIEAVGLIKSEGTLHQKATGSPFQIAGLDYDDNFRVGTDVDVDILRDGMQFYPVLIVGGEKIVGKGSYGMGIQPRSCIGQTSTKDTLMLVIDGRQPGHSIGTTVSVCADILLRYDCFTAMHNDGGSSAIMTYLGEPITKNSANNMPDGRYFPCAWLVLKPGYTTPAQTAEGGE